MTTDPRGIITDITQADGGADRVPRDERSARVKNYFTDAAVRGGHQPGATEGRVTNYELTREPGTASSRCFLQRDHLHDVTESCRRSPRHAT